MAKAPGLAPPALSYIVGVIGVSLLACALIWLESPPHSVSTILIWAAAALAGEIMVFQTLTGRASINLATTMHFAMIFVLEPGQILAALLLSRGVMMFVIKRRLWYRALFNVSQVTLAVLAATYVLRSFLGAEGPLLSHGLQELALPFLCAALTYYVVNIGSVSGVVALTTRDTFWHAWRENYGYMTELVSTLALMLLGPVVAICHSAVGFLGILAFLFPMMLVRVAGESHIILRRSHNAYVSAERLAAKGEIAAKLGNEINNFLGDMSSKIKLLQTTLDGTPKEDLLQSLDETLSHVAKFKDMGTGLALFTRKECQLAPTYLGDLVARTVGFLKPQERFRDIKFEVELDENLSEVVVDPSQLQQVFLNLITNAADAMSEMSTREKVISVLVRHHMISQKIEIVVADSGSGVPESLRDRIFEPGFSTRGDGMGFGLSVAYRIIRNHGGSIRATDNPGGGALFRIYLPVRTLAEQLSGSVAPQAA
jgi:signal transduction histidine kinase